MNCEDYARKLAEILMGLNFQQNSALAFSGGLDSSVIAYLMKDLTPTLYTVGLKNSRDVKNAVEVSKVLGLRVEIIEFTENDILEGVKFLKKIDESMSPVEISFELPLYFVLKKSKEKVVYCGQGADELFGGYRKYLENPEKMSGDLEKLLDVGLKREVTIAKRLGKKLEYPYLNSEITGLSKEMPLECKIRGDIRKWILRMAAEIIGVPEIITRREKKAAQYGSGVWKEMKRMAKRNGKEISEFIEKI